MTLEVAVAKLKATGDVADLKDADEQLANIDAAVTAGNPRDLMHAANEMTRIAAAIDRQFNPKVPVEVTLLDYYGREIEIWSRENDTAKLKETRTALENTWSAVRSQVVSSGGSTEASQFDALVSRLAKAKSSTDFAASATPILDAVDTLENAFTRSADPLPGGAAAPPPAAASPLP